MVEQAFLLQPIGGQTRQPALLGFVHGGDGKLQGAVFRGYFAFKEILRRLPLTWPLLLLFHLPGADAIGPRVYAWVARNRRRLGCTTETCELPPRSGPTPRAQ